MPRGVKLEANERNTIIRTSRRAQIRDSSGTPTPMPGPTVSSGNTTIPDDSSMGDMETQETRQSSSNSTVEPEDAMVMSRNASRSQPQRRSQAIPETPTGNAAHHDDALFKLAAGSRGLIKAIQNLSALNVQATLPSLPRFVVVGDQSAGKSSIIEALCDITLPRSQGTCTRCPFEITTSAASGPAGSWKCTISIVTQYSYLPRARPQPPFGHWHTVDQRIDVFAVVTSKDDLEEKLKRAQVAILNPNSAADFATSNLPEYPRVMRQVAFTPNVIRLEVQAPNLPELSVYDLPGAINNHEDENEQFVVPFIEELIKVYVSDSNTKVLLTCPADQDMENCTAYRYIKIAGAKDRCIGVLTKVDLIETSKLSTVRAMLAGEAYALPHGHWFVTKQPSPKELADGITHQEARMREQEFFDQPEWRLTAQQHPEQVGIRQLQHAISALYIKAISTHVPEMCNRVDRRLDSIERELAGFAPEPKHPAYTVMSELHSVAMALSEQVDTSNTKGFSVCHRTLSQEFADQLAKLRPRIDWRTPGYVPKVISLDEDDDEPASSLATPTPKVRPVFVVTKTSTPASSSKKRSMPTHETPTPRKQAKREPLSTAPGLQNTVITLKKAKEEYDADDATGMGTLSAKVSEAFVLAALEPWARATQRMLRKLQNEFVSMVQATLKAALAPHQQTKLYRDAEKILLQLASDLCQEVSTSVHHSLALEQHRAMTNTGVAQPSIMPLLSSANREALLAARHRVHMDEHFDALEADSGQKVNEEQRLKRASTAAWTEANPDVYKRYVHGFTSIMTYYDIASWRFAEVTAQSISCDLMRRMKATVADALNEGLPIKDDAACARLLAEDPVRELQRAALCAEQVKLVKAKAELDALHGVQAIE